MIYLDVEEVLRLHYELIEDFGGSHGVRGEHRLQSAVEAPKQNVFGQEQYPTIFEKAAVYMRAIIADHPFIDGNKRTAVTVAGIFLMRNRTHLTASQKALEDFAVKIAVDHLSVKQITAWLKSHTK